MATGRGTGHYLLTTPESVDLFGDPLRADEDLDLNLSDLQLEADFLSRLSQFGQTLSTLPYSPETQHGQGGVGRASPARSESGLFCPDFLVQSHPGSSRRPTVSSNTANRTSFIRQISTVSVPASRSSTDRGRTTNPLQPAFAQGQSQSSTVGGRNINPQPAFAQGQPRSSSDGGRNTNPQPAFAQGQPQSSTVGRRNINPQPAFTQGQPQSSTIGGRTINSQPAFLQGQPQSSTVGGRNTNPQPAFTQGQTQNSTAGARNTNPQPALAQGPTRRALGNFPANSSPFTRQIQSSHHRSRGPHHQRPSSQAEAVSARNTQTPLLTSDDDDDDDEVSCPICAESRRYLKKLPCKHCFCEYCLQRIVNEHERTTSGHFPCPFCRAVTAIPERGASDFPISTAGHSQFLQLEEVASTLSRVKRLQQECTERCQGCGEEDSRYTCLQCQKQVCDYCRHDHHQHPLLLLSSFNSLTVHTDQAVSHCNTHPSREIHVFCSSCNQLLCDICQRGTHAQHKMQNLSQAAASARKFLGKTQNDVIRGLRLLHVAQEHAKKEKRLTLREISQSEQTIRSRAAEARALIDQCEKVALSTLKDRRKVFKSKRKQELNAIEDKMAGMSAILNHMERILLSDKEPDLIRMQVSASDTVGKDGFLDKYTSDLPFYQCSVDMKHEPFARFSEAAKQWIGTPALTASPSAADVVEVLADVALIMDNTQTMTVLSVCPVGDQNAWMAYEQSTGSAAITFLGLCDLGTGQVSRISPIDSPVSLVKIDQGLALATFHNHQTVLVLEGKHEMLPSEIVYERILFAKRNLQACLQITRARHNPLLRHTDLITHVKTAQDVFKAKKDVFRLSGLHDPQQIDMSSDGQLFVIMDKAQTLHVVKRGATRAHMLVSAEQNSKVFHIISDVCFYMLGGREALLLADPFQDDVLVLEVSKGHCSLLGFLTNMSGRLQHPSALNVDSTHLLVACGGKSIALCGDTGVRLDESTGSYPTRLKTR